MATHKYHKILSAAMKEVHKRVPRNVTKTGKTGAAKEKMLQAIAFSKARRARNKRKKY